MIPRLGALSLLFVLLAGAADPTTFQLERRRYWEALDPVCRTGVTPVMVERYREAAAAIAAAKYGGGQDNSFWGLKTPEQAWLARVQAPGNLL